MSCCCVSSQQNPVAYEPPKGLLAHFHCPWGLFGLIAGQFMALTNAAVNRWAVERLRLQEHEEVLEIGYGAGTAIKHAFKVEPSLSISGLDLSPEMNVSASMLNARHIKEDQCHLTVGTVQDVYEFSKQFDTVFAVNNVMYWENLLTDLLHLRQYLKPDGKLCLFIQRCCQNCYDSGKNNEEIQHYATHLAQAGYKNIQVNVEEIDKSSKINKFLSLIPFFNETNQLGDRVLGICIEAENPRFLESLSTFYFNQLDPWMAKSVYVSSHHEQPIYSHLND